MSISGRGSNVDEVTGITVANRRRSTWLNIMLLLHQVPNYNMDLPREKMMEMTKRYMAWADELRQKGKLVGGEKLTAERRPPHQGQGRQAGRQRRPLRRGQGRDRRLFHARGQGPGRGRGDHPGVPASRAVATNWAELRPIDDMAQARAPPADADTEHLSTGSSIRSPAIDEPAGRRPGAAARHRPHRRRGGRRPACADAGAVALAVQGRAGQARGVALDRRAQPRARPAATRAART